MTPQIIGIVLSVFTLAFSAFIAWGAFVEQKRGNADSAAALAKR